MTRILVTGAGGFVCRHIIDTLLALGHEVIAADQQFSPALRAHWQNRALDLWEGDLQALPPFPVDVLIHGAAVTASPEERGESPEENLRANLDPFLFMLEWAARQEVHRAFFLSSSGVYHATAPGLVEEPQVPTPLGTYAIAKTFLEHTINSLKMQHGRDVVALRLSFIYGFDEQPSATRPRISLIGELLHDALTKGVISVNRQALPRDWTFAPDLGQAIHALMQPQSLRHSLYHVASQQSYTAGEIAAVIQQQLPQVEIAWTDAPDLLTRQGVLSHARLQAETGAIAWTALESGIAQMLHKAQAVQA